MDEKTILETIESFENFPLSENQQKLVNYLRANIEELYETFSN